LLEILFCYVKIGTVKVYFIREWLSSFQAMKICQPEVNDEETMPWKIPETLACCELG
jgi:hypothetical protein